MDTLQIQDAFQPYYADRPPRRAGRSETVAVAEDAAKSDRSREMLKRLEQCRASLARAIELQEHQF